MDKFLAQIGAQMGGGFQGDVYEFGTGGTKVVKKLRRFRGRERKDMISDINKEIVNAIFAGDMGIGPVIHEFRFLGDHVYIVMEKITPYALVQSDLPRLIALFTKLIEIGLVNLDGGFGLRKGQLVLYDYGVSSIVPSPHKARREYLDSDYFYNFHDMLGVAGLQEHFSGKKELGIAGKIKK